MNLVPTTILCLLVATAGCAAGNAERGAREGVTDDDGGEVVVIVKLSGAASAGGGSDLRPVSASARDCDSEHIECFNRCWKSRVPWPHSLAKDARYRFCQAKCLAEYMACLGAKVAQYSFASMGAAMAWLNEHRDVAAGAVIVAAAGVFVVATDGAGALFLSPLAARAR